MNGIKLSFENVRRIETVRLYIRVNDDSPERDKKELLLLVHDEGYTDATVDDLVNEIIDGANVFSFSVGVEITGTGYNQLCFDDKIVPVTNLL